MKARPYQERALVALMRYLLDNETGNPIAALPTASGKSFVQAEFIHRTLKAPRFSHWRFLCLTHVLELIEQNHAKLHDVWPFAPTGICSASIGKHEPWAPVVFAGIQSVHKKAAELGWRDIVFIDECHLLSPDNVTMYRALIAELLKINPKLRVAGLTATAYRTGQGLLTEGENALFDDIVIDLTQGAEFVELVDDGYLSEISAPQMSTVIDVSGVGTIGDDFNAKQLREVTDQEKLTRAAIQEMLIHGSDRHSWLVFCVDVAHAQHVTALMREYGIDTDIVHGGIEKKAKGRGWLGGKESATRDSILAKLKDWKSRWSPERGTFGTYAVVNVGCWTTGLDVPALDLIATLRSTKSPILHVQIIGRGARVCYMYDMLLDTREQRWAAIHAGPKPRGCIALDFAGNTARLGPINAITVPQSKKKRPTTEQKRVEKELEKKGQKACPTCGKEQPLLVRICSNPQCKHEFSAVKILAKAGRDKLIARAADLDVWHDLRDCWYTVHQPPKQKAMLKVGYGCESGTFHKLICFGWPSQAGEEAAKWWAEVASGPTPQSAEEAMWRNREIAKPEKIHVRHGKYPGVIGQSGLSVPTPAPRIDSQLAWDFGKAGVDQTVVGVQALRPPVPVQIAPRSAAPSLQPPF